MPRYLALIFAILIFIGAGKTQVFGQTATRAEGHAYIYRSEKHYGLCDKEGNALTEAKYLKIRQYNHFLLGMISNDKGWDLYTADGVNITNVSCVVPVNEHEMVALNFNNTSTIARRMIDTGVVTGTFNVIEGYLGEFSQTHAADKPEALNARIAKSGGGLEELPFKIIAKPTAANVFIVVTDKLIGAYEVDQHRVVVPVHYNSVRFIKDSFLLGWNSSSDFDLFNLNGKSYPFDSVVANAYYINKNATLASVGISKPEVYNYLGKKLGNDLTRTTLDKPYFLVQEKAKYLKDSKLEHTWLEKEVSWLVDIAGKPIISATDLQDSSVKFLYGDLFAVYKTEKVSGQKFISLLYNAQKKTVIAKATKADQIIWQQPYVAKKDGSSWLVYDGEGDVMAHIPVIQQLSPSENLQTLVHKMSFEGGLIWRKSPTDELWNLIHTGAKKMQFQQIKFCHDRDVFMGKQDNKWGLYRYKINDGLQVTVSTLVPAKYDSINDWTHGAIYRLTENKTYLWVDAKGKILLGGKSFEYLSPLFLPDGTGLAFEGERSIIDEKEWGIGSGQRREFLATKLMIVDADGRVQYQQKIEPSNKVLIYFPKEDVTKVALVNNYSVIANNVLYNLRDQKSEPVLKGYEMYNLLIAKGRAVSITGFKGSKNYNQVGAIVAPKYNPWFNREWKKVITLSLLDSKRSTKINGTPLPFFSDAVGFYGVKEKNVKVVVSDDGMVYE